MSRPDQDDQRAALFARVRDGDWEAIEDLVSGASAPAFDAALGLFGDPVLAGKAAEDALLAALLGARAGELGGADPLLGVARSLAACAAATGAAPFAAGLSPDDLLILGRRPDDARGSTFAKVARSDRVDAVLAFALDLEADEMARALGRPRAEIEAAVGRVLAAIPHECPGSALRDVLDARASQVRLPGDIVDRVLDRYEAL